MNRIVFQKSGTEIKQAIQSRIQELQSRLDRRNQALESFLQDTKKVRSYLVRSAKSSFSGHARTAQTLYSQEDISSEEKEEISQLCARILEIEQELNQLSLVSTHLNDNQMLELSFDDLVRFGFSAGTGMEVE